MPWDYRWVPWPDFGLPTNDHDAVHVFDQAWQRAGDERVEVACWGGMGRTGTVLASLAILDGLPPARAVSYVRACGRSTDRWRRESTTTPMQRTMWCPQCVRNFVL